MNGSDVLTAAMIEAATRVVCHGLPLPEPGEPDLHETARGVCLGPNCPCWEPGTAVTVAALKAAEAARARG